MSHNLDTFDAVILTILQRDASLSMDAIAEQVNLSRNACWRRIRLMEEAGIIKGRVVLADPKALGCGQEVIVMIRAGRHDADWLEAFHKAVRAMPEVVGAYRMTGDLDYLLRVRVADVQAYDAFYKRVIQRIPLSDISASFVMEEIKETTALPV